MDCACEIDYGGDFEPWHVVDYKKDAKALTVIKCDDCRRKINLGEKYERWYGILDGEHIIHRCCPDCSSTAEVIFDGAAPLGGIWDEIYAHIYDVCNGEVPSECLLKLTAKSRSKMCDIIQSYWEHAEESGFYDE